MRLPIFVRVFSLQIALLALALLAPAPAWAHSLNESYVYFKVTDDALSGRIEVHTRDLARVLDRDDTDPEAWSKEEVEDRAQEILDYFEGRLLLRSEGQIYPVVLQDIGFLGKQLIDGTTFAQLKFSVPELTRTPDTIEMSYDFMFSDVDPTHRGFALIDSNTRTGVARNESYISLIFEPGDGFKTLYLNGEPAWDVFVGFVEHGVWHIWLGFDHVLFLVTLLFTAVMVLSMGRWEPAPSLRGALKKTLKIVTVFTLAHSVTLGLAAFDIIKLNTTLVEAVIALSIAFVALGNIFPRLHLGNWKVILVFGLFHGFGFANVLAPLGLDPARKAIGLLAFNIGVELGQIAIVIVLFPILFLIRRAAFYRPVFLYLGSVFLIGIACFWFIERTYDVLGPVREIVFG
jgi:hypothetical protein